MSSASNPLRLCVLSPHGILLDIEVQSVRLNASDGSRGVHKGHPEAVILLSRGEISYVKDGERHVFDANGGFAQVKDNVVTVITERN